MVDLSKRRLFSRRSEVASVKLPWLASTTNFTDTCTRCNKCIEACETNIIIKGDGGFPTVDFSKGECTFCYQCAESCPESLFNAKETTPWNIVATFDDTCLAKKNVECRSCSDMCDEMAIQFKLQIGHVAIPHLNSADCSGCGACVAACPTSAIQVTSSSSISLD